MLRKYSFDGEMEAVSEPNLLSDIGVACVCGCVCARIFVISHTVHVISKKVQTY